MKYKRKRAVRDSVSVMSPTTHSILVDDHILKLPQLTSPGHQSTITVAQNKTGVVPLIPFKQSFGKEGLLYSNLKSS